jgi:hypothetical protein
MAVCLDLYQYKNVCQPFAHFISFLVSFLFPIPGYLCGMVVVTLLIITICTDLLSLYCGY